MAVSHKIAVHDSENIYRPERLKTSILQARRFG
jgi:hypothetical protein